MDVEYVRSLNCNYERILLKEQPKENRYQYCILNRGGVKGLLPCDLRYIDGNAYLYYEITSKQDITHIYDTKSICREEFLRFVECLRMVQQELDRFLLDVKNMVWHPEQIFRDLEKERYSFLYVPYCEEDTGLRRFMEFLVDKIDYDDGALVDMVYHMYEQCEKQGLDYFTKAIFEEVQALEEEAVSPVKEEPTIEESAGVAYFSESEEENKKGLLSFFDTKRTRARKPKEEYRDMMEERMPISMVAEESNYGSAGKEENREYGRTIYIESVPPTVRTIRRLYSPEGEVLAVIEEKPITIGKFEQEADVVLEDASVSRLHAKVTKEDDVFYLQDLNSTNGTYKNGLRLNPYEKRRLDVGDEIKCGRVLFTFQ